jgi:integrase
MRHLTEEMQPVIHVAYLTGWRLSSEILPLKRSQLDVKSGWLRLDPGETKNKEGRNFPLTEELRGVLEAQTARTRALEREMGQIIPWLFHRQDGRQIKSLKHAFASACKAAGVPGRKIHDFRRTAGRNFERIGVSRSAAKKMGGWKTDSMYQRYAIADEVALKEAAAKIDASLVSTEGTQHLSKLSQSKGSQSRAK